MALTRRQLLAIAGGAALTSVASGCGGASTPVVDTGSALGSQYDGPPVTISYWNGFTGGDGPAMRDLVAQFNASQDRITVEQNTIQWAQYYQRVVAAIHAGRGPDVGAMHLEQLATQAARQTVNPLDDVLEEARARRRPVPPAGVGRRHRRRRQVRRPAGRALPGQHTNRSLLQRVDVSKQPTNGDEVRQVLDEMTSAGVETPFWMPNRWPAHLMFLSLLWQNGGEPYAEDGSKALFDSDAGVEALSWMRQQVKAGYSPDNVAVDTQYTAFKNGEGAFTWDGIWQVNDLEAAAADLDWGMAPIPTIGEKPAVWANSHHLVLFRNRAPDDDRLQAGKAFIRFLTEQSAAWSGAGMIPARNEARETAEFTDSPQAALAPAIPAMRFLPSVPGVPDVQAQTLETAVSEAVLGRLDPDVALRDAADRATQLLQANLEKFGR